MACGASNDEKDKDEKWTYEPLVLGDFLEHFEIMGGGFPIGAFCASADIMERTDNTKFNRGNLAFHGGTFTGNPITMTAGTATLSILEDGKVIRELNETGEKIRADLHDIFDRNYIRAQITGVSSLFNVHFVDGPIKDTVTCSREDKKRLSDYHMRLITKGVFFLPTHNGNIGATHSQKDVEKLLSETEDYTKNYKS